MTALLWALRMDDHLKKLSAWASIKPSSRKCLTCRDDRISELIREFLRLVDSGETTRSLMGFHAWLCEEHGYELGYTALRNHTLRCVGWTGR